MTTVKRTERILKDLEKLVDDSNKSASNCAVLEEKVAIHRLRKVLVNARHEIRLNYYGFEDIEKHLDR